MSPALPRITLVPPPSLASPPRIPPHIEKIPLIVCGFIVIVITALVIKLNHKKGKPIILPDEFDMQRVDEEAPPLREDWYNVEEEMQRTETSYEPNYAESQPIRRVSAPQVPKASSLSLTYQGERKSREDQRSKVSNTSQGSRSQQPDRRPPSPQLMPYVHETATSVDAAQHWGSSNVPNDRSYDEPEEYLATPGGTLRNSVAPSAFSTATVDLAAKYPTLNVYSHLHLPEYEGSVAPSNYQPRKGPIGDDWM